MLKDADNANNANNDR